MRLKETISPKCLRVCLALGHTCFNVRSIKRAQVFPDYLLCFLPDTSVLWWQRFCLWWLLYVHLKYSLWTDRFWGLLWKQVRRDYVKSFFTSPEAFLKIYDLQTVSRCFSCADTHAEFNSWCKPSVWLLHKDKAQSLIFKKSASLVWCPALWKNVHVCFFFLPLHDSINAEIVSRDDTSHGISCPGVVPWDVWVYVGSIFLFCFYAFWSTPLSFGLFSLSSSRHMFCIKLAVCSVFHIVYFFDPWFT